MNTQKNNNLVNENINKVADEKKREFMKKFGKYAASAPVAGFALMTLGSSKAAASNEWGLLG